MTLLDGVLNITQACAEACTPVIVYALLRKLGLDKDALANTVLTTAINRSVGLMVAEGMKRGDPFLAHEETLRPALGTAMTYIQEAAGKETKRLGITPDMIGQKIASQLALTLHVPNVQTVPALTVIGKST